MLVRAIPVVPNGAIAVVTKRLKFFGEIVLDDPAIEQFTTEAFTIIAFVILTPSSDMINSKEFRSLFPAARARFAITSENDAS